MARSKNPELPETWPQRARFVELVDAKVAEGTSLEAVAAALGRSSTRSLEHEWRYDKSRRPGRKTLELAAAYFGVSLWELDGPPAPGEPLVEEQGVAEDALPYSAEEQFDLRALGTNLKRLTPEARARVIEAWQAVLRTSVPMQATIETKVTRAKSNEGPKRSRD